VTICDGIVQGRGGTWSSGGTIVFGTNSTGLFKVPAAGGTATPLTTLDRSLKERAHWYPWFLPDGRHFLYTAAPDVIEQSVVYVADMDAKEPARSRRKVVAAVSTAMYASGYILFMRDRTVMAQSFDAGRGETTGEAVPVAEQVVHPGGETWGGFSISQNGYLAYISGVTDASSQISWFDRAGREISKVGAPGSYRNLRLAPDEKRIAFERNDEQSRTADIWVMDLVRGVTSRLTFDPAPDTFPLWSPDGLQILYGNKRSGRWDFYVKAATGAGHEELLLELGARNASATSWSQDGRFIMYGAGTPGDKTQFDLWIAPQFGDRKPYPYLQTQFNE
jgi:eukaryotic-like serine/threonine-protein kinase